MTRKIHIQHILLLISIHCCLNKRAHSATIGRADYVYTWDSVILRHSGTASCRLYGAEGGTQVHSSDVEFLLSLWINLCSIQTFGWGEICSLSGSQFALFSSTDLNNKLVLALFLLIRYPNKREFAQLTILGESPSFCQNKVETRSVVMAEEMDACLLRCLLARLCPAQSSTFT